MPRLIDADKLIYSDGREYLPTGEYITILDIENAPTVDAIPIEWILTHEKMPKEGKGHDAIMDMIESWRTEDAEIHNQP